MVQTALALTALIFCAWEGIVCIRRLAFEKPQLPGAAPDFNERLSILGLSFIVALVYMGLTVFAAKLELPGAGTEQALKAFLEKNIDARHYRDLAQFGYGRGEGFYEQELMIVFFPLWPLIWKLAALNGLLPWYTVGMIIQLPMICIAAVMIYELVYRQHGKSAAGWALAFLALSPGGVFCALPMTESLFLLLTAGFFLSLQREKMLSAAVFGLLAALTRSPGALLSGAALMYMVQHRRCPSCRSWLPVAAPAAGLCAYLGLNKAVYGNWTQFSLVQKQHWNQGLGFFPETVRYELDYCLGYLGQGNWKMGIFLFGAGFLTVLLVFVALAPGVKKLPAHQLAYSLAYCAFTMGASWLLSAPRYAMVLFFLPASLAAGLENDKIRRCILSVLFPLALVYTFAFLRHWSIY